MGSGKMSGRRETGSGIRISEEAVITQYALKWGERKLDRLMLPGPNGRTDEPDRVTEPRH